MLAMLCSALEAQPRDLPLRRMVYSGAPISTRALTQAMRLLDCNFVQLYGLTEATGAFAQLPSDEHDPAGERAYLLRSAGHPYPWVEVRLVSTDSGEDVADGEIGEIWTRSEQNFVGYWNQPNETARAFAADGWLRTGDLGHRDQDGRLYLVDRAVDRIVSGGENIYPNEVEAALATFPGMDQVAVIGVPSDRWGETVKAIVTAQPGVVIEPADVIAFVRTQLAKFKCPTRLDVVTAMPTTATGKIQKTRLREPYWAGHDRRIN